MVALQALDGRDGLEPHEAVGIGKGSHQHVHGRAGWQAGESGRDVPPHPDLLAWVPHRMSQGVDHVLAVADQRRAGLGLQEPMPEQGHQAGQEQAIRHAHAPGAADGFSYDVDIVIVE